MSRPPKQNLITHHEPLRPPEQMLRRLDDLANSPFKLLINYGGPEGTPQARRKYLDALHKRGLYEIYSLKDHYANGVWGSSPFLRGRTEEAALREDVAELVDHPAILGWYISDEETDHEAVRKHHEWVKNADPTRFTLTLTNLPLRDQIAPFANAADVLANDPYPIGNGGAVTDVARVTDETVSVTGGKQPAWIVVQAYGGYVYRDDFRDKPGALIPVDAMRGRGRAPTPREMRCMTFLAVTRGATGIVFYYYNDIRQMIDSELRWAAVKQIGQELVDISPILLAPDIARAHLSSDNDEHMYWRAKRTDEGLAIVAVNADTDTQSAKFQLPVPIKSAKLLSGSGTVYSNGKELLVLADGYEAVTVDVKLQEMFDWAAVPKPREEARRDTAVKTSYWRFEQGGVKKVRDELGGADGIFTGRISTAKVKPVERVAGAPNKQSMEFFGDGHSSLIMEDVDALNVGTADFTLEAWICPRVAKDQAMIAGKGITGNFEDKGYQLVVRPVGKVGESQQFVVRFETSASDRAMESRSLAFNKWHHVAVRRVSRQLLLYIDGREADDLKLVPPADLSSRQRFSIGCHAFAGKGEPVMQFNGHIDEVRLTIGKALEPSEFLCAQPGIQPPTR